MFGSLLFYNNRTDLINCKSIIFGLSLKIVSCIRTIAVTQIRIGLRARVAATASFNVDRSKYFASKIVRYIRSFIGGRQVIQKVSNNFTTWPVEKCTYNLGNIDERLLR